MQKEMVKKETVTIFKKITIKNINSTLISIICEYFDWIIVKILLDWHFALGNVISKSSVCSSPVVRKVWFHDLQHYVTWEVIKFSGSI